MAFLRGGRFALSRWTLLHVLFRLESQGAISVAESKLALSFFIATGSALLLSTLNNLHCSWPL